MSSPLAGIARFPRARLGHAPTPLERAPNLGAALGIELWIKRDDCTGLALGGNKVRQLEFHFGAARARGADTVLATGAVQSNLVRIAAAAGRRLGMEVHVQLEDRVDGAGALYRESGNVLLDRVLGAALHSFPQGEDEAAADAAMERRAAALADEGRTAYVIRSAPGGEPLGGLGYVEAAGEIAAQAVEGRQGEHVSGRREVWGGLRETQIYQERKTTLSRRRRPGPGLIWKMAARRRKEGARRGLLRQVHFVECKKTLYL